MAASDPFNWGGSEWQYNHDVSKLRGGWDDADAFQQQSRQGHLDYINMLQAAARGEGPSVAQAQLRQATDANIANAYSMAASTRGGGSYALAQRTAQQQAAQANQAAAAKAAELRAQEIWAARSGLGDAWAQQRAQDMGAMGMNMNAYMGVQQEQMQARLAYEDMLELEAQRKAGERDSKRKFWGGIIQTAGELAGNAAKSAAGGGGGAAA